MAHSGPLLSFRSYSTQIRHIGEKSTRQFQLPGHAGSSTQSLGNGYHHASSTPQLGAKLNPMKSAVSLQTACWAR
jgi:hypothetical protein